MAKKTATTNKRGRGCPPKFDWKKMNGKWRSMTTREVATFMGCTVPRAHTKRNDLIRAAKDAGKTGATFVCRKKPYTRVKAAK